MSEDDIDDRDVLLPRETSVLFGHNEAESALLESYQSGRIPHAWLIGGPPGIGKATLAYRLARFVLAHPDPKSPVVQKAKSLALDSDNPVARRVAAQAQGDLLVLERVINEQTGKLYTVIRVDDVRRSVPFLAVSCPLPYATGFLRYGCPRLQPVRQRRVWPLRSLGVR